jgi:hypothetical protein
MVTVSINVPANYRNGWSDHDLCNLVWAHNWGFYDFITVTKAPHRGASVCARET